MNWKLFKPGYWNGVWNQEMYNVNEKQRKTGHNSKDSTPNNGKKIINIQEYFKHIQIIMKKKL